MAKGQVTEEQLASGLKGIGNFGALAGSGRVQRDNPFRDSRAEVPAAPPVKKIEVAPAPAAAAPVEPSVPTKEAKPAEPRPKAVPKVASVVKPMKEGRAESAKAAARKADLFTERVTLQLSPEVRDDVDSLARDIQRAKTTMDERITANTVMRVAVQVLIDHFQFQRGDLANSEEELYELVRAKLKLR